MTGVDKSEDSRGLLDYWVVKTDATGSVEWDKTVGGPGNDLLFALIENSNHNLYYKIIYDHICFIISIFMFK